MTENDAGASPPPLDDDALLAALTDALAPPARSVPAERRDELRRLVAADAGPDTVRPLSAARSGRAERAMRSRRAVLLGGVAAGIGAVVGATAVLATDDDDAQPEQAGPPTRPVAFASTPVGATASARTIDHAWGMEVMLDVQGLPAGSDYAVTYETAAGPVAAGGFRAVADVVMHCRFNATALRDQVDAVVVVHEGSGTEVLRGTLA